MDQKKKGRSKFHQRTNQLLLSHTFCSSLSSLVSDEPSLPSSLLDNISQQHRQQEKQFQKEQTRRAAKSKYKAHLLEALSAEADVPFLPSSDFSGEPLAFPELPLLVDPLIFPSIGLTSTSLAGYGMFCRRETAPSSNNYNK